MTIAMERQTRSKPFLKWAGGKGQLIKDIEQRLPEELRNGRIDEYIKPFVGSGADVMKIARVMI